MHRWVGDLLESWVRHHHLSLFRKAWRTLKEPPHFEDHRNFLNLWYLDGKKGWPLGRNPDFLMRGLFNRMVIKKGDTVLDVCCGDGFFDYLFYSPLANQIDALDFDVEALKLARHYHQYVNIRYYQSNCLTESFPKNFYDVIIFDGAIAHFRKEEIDLLMNKFKGCLSAGGILVGSEALERLEEKTWDHHQIFPNAQDLEQFLKSYFPYVSVKTLDPIGDRYQEAYFRCSVAQPKDDFYF